jgi:hypothetical protein
MPTTLSGRPLGRGVRGQDRLRPAGFVQTPEQAELQLELLGGRFDDDVDSGQRIHRRDAFDPVQGRLALVVADPVLGEEAVEALLDGLETLLDASVVEVVHDDAKAAGRRDLGDAAAHGAGTDDADGFDCHAGLLR